ncbi:ATP-binding cassette domain-containing protein [Haloarculaceae archaeon H-GB2-1]|nr:ATP-binding cassette domain-containing protein [Haloarculaceae archaeon H-GB2-1]
MRIDGTPREFDSPRDAIDAGIGMIHQHFMLVDPMTVADNVVLGNEPRSRLGFTVDREAAREAVTDLTARYGFDVEPDAVVEDLSVGVQQRVEILKALYRGADILILDEPTAVLTPQEVEELFDIFDELTDQGRRSSSSRTSWAKRSAWPTPSPSSATAKRSAPSTRRRRRSGNWRN